MAVIGNPSGSHRQGRRSHGGGEVHVGVGGIDRGTRRIPERTEEGKIKANVGIRSIIQPVDVKLLVCRNHIARSSGLRSPEQPQAVGVQHDGIDLGLGQGIGDIGSQQAIVGIPCSCSPVHISTKGSIGVSVGIGHGCPIIIVEIVPDVAVGIRVGLAGSPEAGCVIKVDQVGLGMDDRAGNERKDCNACCTREAREPRKVHEFHDKMGDGFPNHS